MLGSPSWKLAGAVAAVTALLLPNAIEARKFYPDDPLWKEPRPYPVKNPKSRKLSEYYDFFHHTLFRPGERQPAEGMIHSRGVNTLGEVPDSGWYANRHWLHPMSREELVRGPGAEHAPAEDGAWTVVAAKSEGVTPGFTIKDSAGRRYILKFDPLTNPEMASAADVIVSRFFYALGYHVPENYVVYFRPEKLVVSPDTRILDANGKHRRMTSRDITELLLRVPKDPEKGYRAIASRYIGGKILGPFRYYGVRLDDSNDVIPHEHRRELRGLFVLAAWLGHSDIKSLNTLDTLVEEDGVPYIKHHLIDFGASLGSDSFTAKSPRAGNEYLFAWKPAAKQFFTLGLLVPGWARADYPDLPSAGRFEYEVFEPERWKPNYPIPAFENRLPDDSFWAARQVMAFTDEEIRTIVKTGEFSDPEAEDWIVRCLIERRNKIGRTYFRMVLPLDRIEVRDGRLTFVDLAAKYGFAAAASYKVEWSRFDNENEEKIPLDGQASFTLPRAIQAAAPGECFAAGIRSPDPKKSVTVYVRRETGGVQVVGIERTW